MGAHICYQPLNLLFEVTNNQGITLKFKNLGELHKKKSTELSEQRMAMV